MCGYGWWQTQSGYRVLRLLQSGGRKTKAELPSPLFALWELARLIARGRIHAYGTVDASVRLLIEGVSVKPITPEIAALTAQFPETYPREAADLLDRRNRTRRRQAPDHARCGHLQKPASNNDLAVVARRSFGSGAVRLGPGQKI